MFTLAQLKTAHAQVTSGADFPRYIQAIKTLGVVSYETFVADGHTHYAGKDNYTIASPARYAPLAIAATPNAETFTQQLKAHQQGKTDFPTFCGICASTGVHKWVVLLEAMTCTYYDVAGKEMLVEQIPGCKRTRSLSDALRFIILRSQIINVPKAGDVDGVLKRLG